MKKKILGLIFTLFILAVPFSTYADSVNDGEIIEIKELTQEEIDYIESIDPVNRPKANSLEENAVHSYADLGTFKLTAYCSCDTCNYPYGGLPTAFGTDYVEGRTIAVDPRVIPLGSFVEIDIPGESWHQYRAEDTGGKIKGKRIDILVNGHGNCNQARYNTNCAVRLIK